MWSRYGSWKEVALALRVNEDTANRRRSERERQSGSYVDVVTDPLELNWAEQAIAKMGSWQPVLDNAKSMDLYSSMYGDNGSYIPANLFAGVPNPGDDTRNKMLWVAQKVSGNEIAVNSIMESVMKKAAGNAIPKYTGERKY